MYYHVPKPNEVNFDIEFRYRISISKFDIEVSNFGIEFRYRISVSPMLSATSTSQLKLDAADSKLVSEAAYRRWYCIWRSAGQVKYVKISRWHIVWYTYFNWTKLYSILWAMLGLGLMHSSDFYLFNMHPMSNFDKTLSFGFFYFTMTRNHFV